MTLSVQHTIPQTADNTPALPGPSDTQAWTAELVARIAHGNVHTRPQPDCDLCPPTVCPCGVAGCPDVFDHRRTYAGAETTAWELTA